MDIKKKVILEADHKDSEGQVIAKMTAVITTDEKVVVRTEGAQKMLGYDASGQPYFGYLDEDALKIDQDAMMIAATAEQRTLFDEENK